MEKYIHTKEKILKSIADLQSLIEAELEDIECLPHNLFKCRLDIEYDTSIFKYWQGLQSLKQKLLYECELTRGNRW